MVEEGMPQIQKSHHRRNMIHLFIHSTNIYYLAHASHNLQYLTFSGQRWVLNTSQGHGAYTPMQALHKVPGEALCLSPGHTS